MTTRLILIILMLLPLSFFAKGKVYIVMGSDTGIWDGLDMSKYHHLYRTKLYTDPTGNAHKVMNSDFRDGLRDSRGTPLKMTWWMMSGNTFRHSVNTNIPYANSITFYLMRKYHGEMIEQFGDEISLHYHTWEWTDYDGDGIYYWNQAPGFGRFKEDFEYTLAQNLIDANEFPVSYRSGWHYMDNDWQNYLDNILPFSMHNDYPNKHVDTIEPLDNLYDWSQAPAEFVPYHPSGENYQVYGNLKGWELRSIYMTRVTQQLMDGVFQKAKNGTDQVICIWAHLPEDDFIDNISKVHSVLTSSAAKFSDVDFLYCSAVEAMQNWLAISDKTPPQINIVEEELGNDIYYSISTNENIFQDYPFIASKDIYSRYRIIPLTQTGTNKWRTTIPVDKVTLVKIGFAATDNSGNLATKFINYLPDEIFLDESDECYHEIRGDWNETDNSSWELKSRITEIQPGDSSIAEWTIKVETDCLYTIFIQSPPVTEAADSINIKMHDEEKILFTKTFDEHLPGNKWIYLGTSELEADKNYKLNTIIFNRSTVAKYFATDALKISPIIRDKELTVSAEYINFGAVSQIDTATYSLTLQNTGIKPLTLLDIKSFRGIVSTDIQPPVQIPAMDQVSVNIKFHYYETGAVTDTLFVISDDPITPVLKIPVTASVETPFYIFDNEDKTRYSESGIWSTSVTQAYGNSSRFSYLNQSPRAYAEFTTNLTYAGQYLIQAIVPKTENSTDKALYILNANEKIFDTLLVDQNKNSGTWIDLFQVLLPENSKATLKILDSGESSIGAVLRADAVKFKLLESPVSLVDHSLKTFNDFRLLQNYPNPFNPTTTIRYSIPTENKNTGLTRHVKLTVFDILGREVTVLINNEQRPGNYQIYFDASKLSSGIYIYRLTAGKFTDVKKMILAR